MSYANELHQAIQTEIELLNHAIDDLQGYTPVPIVGEVGGPAERLFCSLAHRFARGELVEPALCPQNINGDCGLTGYVHPCLFCELDSPAWEQIKQSEARRVEVGENAPGLG
ncbi:MAG: hypothetical protein JXA89_07480 [Anaerolineae bacterium]|nr:hypothetical protein [Anaerolineae bacterium]